MDKKLLLICVLTISAIALMLANFTAPPATADMAVSDHDYQVATARIAAGGEALYVLDGRSGLLAVFSYDPSSRSLRQRVVRPVADAFKSGDFK